jgi:hypothetical protein
VRGVIRDGQRIAVFFVVARASPGSRNFLQPDWLVSPNSHLRVRRFSGLGRESEDSTLIPTSVAEVVFSRSMKLFILNRILWD